MLNVKIVLLSTLLILTTVTFLDVVHFQSKTATDLKLLRLKKDFSLFMFEVLLIERSKIRRMKQIVFYAFIALIFIFVAIINLVLKSSEELDILKHHLDVSKTDYDQVKTSYYDHKEELNAHEQAVKVHLAESQRRVKTKADELNAKEKTNTMNEAEIAKKRKKINAERAQTLREIDLEARNLSKKQNALTLLKKDLEQKESIWKNLISDYKTQKKTLRETKALTKIFFTSGFWCTSLGFFETFRKEILVKKICKAYYRACVRRHHTRLIAYKSFEALQYNSIWDSVALRKIYLEIIKEYKVGGSLKIFFDLLKTDFKNKLLLLKNLWAEKDNNNNLKTKKVSFKVKKRFLNGFWRLKVKKILCLKKPSVPKFSLKELNFLRNKYFKFKNKNKN